MMLEEIACRGEVQSFAERRKDRHDDWRLVSDGVAQRLNRNSALVKEARALDIDRLDETPVVIRN